MDYNKNINQLLEKYWNAETTLEEEMWLLENAPNHLDNAIDQKEKSYFDILNKSKEITMNTSFEDLMTAIDSSNTGRVISMNDRASKKLTITRWLSSVAAVILIAAAGWYFMNLDTTPTNAELIAMNTSASESKWLQYEDPNKTPEEALIEVQQALRLVSNKIHETADDAARKISKAEPYTDIFK